MFPELARSPLSFYIQNLEEKVHKKFRIIKNTSVTGKRFDRIR
jgi:hypothetical protein